MKHKTSRTRELGLNKKGQEVRKDKHLNNPDQEAAKRRNECALTRPNHQGWGEMSQHLFLVPTSKGGKCQAEGSMWHWWAKRQGHSDTRTQTSIAIILQIPSSPACLPILFKTQVSSRKPSSPCSHSSSLAASRRSSSGHQARAQGQLSPQPIPVSPCLASQSPAFILRFLTGSLTWR